MRSKERGHGLVRGYQRCPLSYIQVLVVQRRWGAVGERCLVYMSMLVRLRWCLLWWHTASRNAEARKPCVTPLRMGVSVVAGEWNAIRSTHCSILAVVVVVR